MKLFIFLNLFLLANTVQAHGLVTTLTQNTGEYRIEFEIATTGKVFAGDFNNYTVHLFGNGNKEVDFDTAQITLRKEHKPVLVGSVKPTLGGVIPEVGVYTADVVFIDDGRELAKGSFEFNVEPVSSRPNTKKVLGIIAIGVLVSLCYITYRSRITK